MVGFWEAPGRPKIEKNQKKNFIAFSFESSFWEGSWTVLMEFSSGFAWIWNKILKLFWKILGR